MKDFCYSCGAPLGIPGMAGKTPNYCSYCVDEEGKLKPWEEVLAGTAGFLSSWQPDISPEVAQQRALRYLTAMPAWADRA